MKVTSRDLEIYEWIKTYMLEHGYCPSTRDICDGMGIKSTSDVHGHISKLEQYGLIVRKCDYSPVYRLAGMKYVMEQV